MAKVTMPQLGESVAEGTIGKWLKQPGDHVDKYEPLVEVVTDKVNAEVPSPFEGILREILAEEGATVPNNAEIAVIETADDGATDSGRRGADGAGASSQRRRRTGPGRAACHGRGPPPAAPGSGRAPSPRDPPAATSAARPRWHPPRPRPPVAPHRRGAAGRRRPGRADDPGRPPAAARARPVGRPDPGHRWRRPDHPRGRAQGRRGDPDRRGGPGGPGGRRRPRRQRIRRRRARGPGRALRRRPRRRPAGAPIVFPEGADEVLVPMTQMRKGIAAQMTRALAVPHAYVHMEVDATALVRARETAKRDYQAREGISLSYVPFVIKAVGRRAEALPVLQRPLDRRRPRSPSGGSTWASRSRSTTG